MPSKISVEQLLPTPEEEDKLKRLGVDAPVVNNSPEADLYGKWADANFHGRQEEAIAASRMFTKATGLTVEEVREAAAKRAQERSPNG